MKGRFLTASGTGPGLAAIGGVPDTDPEELRRHVARNRLNRARYLAINGEPGAFVELLGDPAIEKTQRDCALAAELLQGKHRRPRGGQRDPDLPRKRAQCLQMAIVMEHHLGFAEHDATMDLAAFYGEKQRTIRDWITERKKEAGPERVAELIAHAGDAYDWLVAGFLDDDLRRLFRLTPE